MTKIKKRMNRSNFISIKRELIVSNSKMRKTMLNILISMETYSTNVEEMFTIDRDSEKRVKHMDLIHDLKRAMAEIKKRVKELKDNLGKNEKALSSLLDGEVEEEEERRRKLSKPKPSY